MAFSSYIVVTPDKSLIPSNQTDFPVLVRSSVGTVTTSGTAVTWAAGDKFPIGIVNTGILINGTAYVVATRTDDSHLVLGSSAGTQGTPVAYCSTPDLRDVSHSGYVQSQYGYDIWGYSDAPPSTRIPLEREYYDAATGNYIGWAKRTLSSSVDAPIILAFGDSGITTDTGTNGDGTYGSTSVWDTNYKGVWHLPNGTTLTANDSTGNINGTVNGTVTVTTGKVDGGANFPGLGTANISAGNSGITTASNKTISAWIYPVWNNAGWKRIVINNATGAIWVTTMHFSDSTHWYAGGTPDNNTHQGDSATSHTFGAWYHVVWVFDGTNWVAYINGSSEILNVDAGGFGIAGTNLVIGTANTDVVSFNGIIDEPRISSTARPADWIAIEYANQNSPGIFESWGARQAIGAGETITLDKWYIPYLQVTRTPNEVIPY